MAEDGHAVRRRAHSQRVLLPGRHQDRIRQRFRLRFGFRVNPTDEIEAGFKLASGNANDPISNNQTFTDEFTSKSINIANAYIKLAPSHSIGLDRPWLTVTGGKFDQPFYVPPTPNQLVYDPDLTPEGFFEALKVVDQKEGWLRTVALNMGQFIIQENSNTGESAIYGFQGLTSMAFDKVMFNFGPAVYHYNDPSSIAVARNTNTSLQITNCVELSDKEVICGKSVNPATAGPNKNGMTDPGGGSGDGGGDHTGQADHDHAADQPVHGGGLPGGPADSDGAAAVAGAAVRGLRDQRRCAQLGCGPGVPGRVHDRLEQGSVRLLVQLRLRAVGHRRGDLGLLRTATSGRSAAPT